MADNSAKVQQGFRILLPLFATYVCREIKLVCGEKWWDEILNTLGDSGRDLPRDGDWNTLTDCLDVANALRLFDRYWGDIFRKKLSLDYRTWAKELMGVRNKLAHIGTNDFSTDDAWRALDTMARLCDAFDDESAEDIRMILRDVRYGEPLRPASQPQPTPHPLRVLRRAAALRRRDAVSPGDRGESDQAALIFLRESRGAEK